MGQSVKQINHLLEQHAEFNELYFDNLLQPIPILIKKQNRADGYYLYKCHKDGTPIQGTTHRACIVISEGLYTRPRDWGLIYGTLIHEMIHQYQAEVLNSDTDHGPRFLDLAATLESTTGYDII